MNDTTDQTTESSAEEETPTLRAVTLAALEALRVVYKHDDFEGGAIVWAGDYNVTVLINGKNAIADIHYTDDMLNETIDNVFEEKSDGKAACAAAFGDLIGAVKFGGDVEAAIAAFNKAYAKAKDEDDDYKVIESAGSDEDGPYVEDRDEDVLRTFDNFWAGWE